MADWDLFPNHLFINRLSYYYLFIIIYSIEQGYHIGIMMDNMKNRPRATTKDLLPSSRHFVIATQGSYLIKME